MTVRAISYEAVCPHGTATWWITTLVPVAAGGVGARSVSAPQCRCPGVDPGWNWLSAALYAPQDA